MRSFKVELLRFGKDAGTFQDRYLVAADGSPVRTVETTVADADILRALDKMRYRELQAAAGTPEAQQQETERQEALKLLRDLVATFLQDLPRFEGKEIVQIDIVTDKVELWALPFEFIQDKGGRDLLGDQERPVLLTRRIRGSFAENAHPWPERPRVLFAWAGKVDHEPHRKALQVALEPWMGPLDMGMAPDARPVLTELPRASLADIAAMCNEAASQKSPRPFTHVHLLAHGAELPDRVAQLRAFGVALEGGTAAAEELAKALRAGESGGPTVVTLAVCDSSNASRTILAGGRLAYELHGRGVPVVIGSQFPLTEPGAAIYMRTFYKCLLADAKDVRAALCTARAELRTAGIPGHDWASVTAHVRLPEGYADQVRDSTLRIKLTQLNTASRWAQRTVEDNVPAGAEIAARIERLLEARIASLEMVFELEPGAASERAMLENLGLLGSAHKRLSELVFHCKGEGFETRSRESLAKAGTFYYQAHERALSDHWTGTQHLAITAVTRGHLPADRSVHWMAALHAARFEARADLSSGDEIRRQVIWANGSIAELCLLGPLLVAPVGVPPTMGDALAALGRLVELAGGERPMKDAIASTWRQLRRYVEWWTAANGFFPGRGEDLSSAAAELVAVLKPHLEK